MFLKLETVDKWTVGKGKVIWLEMLYEFSSRYWAGTNKKGHNIKGMVCKIVY